MKNFAIVLTFLLLIVPTVAFGQELPKRPWGQIYQEDLKNTRGALRGPDGRYYINGSEVTAGDYNIYRALKEMQFELEQLRNEMRELKATMEERSEKP